MEELNHATFMEYASRRSSQSSVAAKEQQVKDSREGEEKEREIYDVVIVGGGLAGVTCAVELLNKGHKIVLLERGSHLGGAAAALEIAPSANHFTSQLSPLVAKDRSEALIELAADLGDVLEDDTMGNEANENSTHILNLCGTVHRSYGDWPKLSVMATQDLSEFLRRIEPVEGAYRQWKAAPMDHEQLAVADRYIAVSLCHFVEKQVKTKEVQQLIRCIVAIYWKMPATTAMQMNMWHFVSVTSNCGGFLGCIRRIFVRQHAGWWNREAVRGTSPQRTPPSDPQYTTNASQHALLRWSRTLREHCRFGKTVTLVQVKHAATSATTAAGADLGEKQQLFMVQTASGEKYCGRRCILALPSPVLRQISLQTTTVHGDVEEDAGHDSSSDHSDHLVELWSRWDATVLLSRPPLILNLTFAAPWWERSSHSGILLEGNGNTRNGGVAGYVRPVGGVPRLEGDRVTEDALLQCWFFALPPPPLSPPSGRHGQASKDGAAAWMKQTLLTAVLLQLQQAWKIEPLPVLATQWYWHSSLGVTALHTVAPRYLHSGMWCWDALMKEQRNRFVQFCCSSAAGEHDNFSCNGAVHLGRGIARQIHATLQHEESGGVNKCNNDTGDDDGDGDDARL